MTMDFKPILPATHTGSPIIIAGPCSAESPEQMLETATRLQRQGVRIFRAGVWKPRTRPGGFEGHGKEALQWLDMVRRRAGMLVATEVGTARQAADALEANIDLLWIGARTTTSPFAVQEIAEVLRGTDTPILVKNPVCPDLDLWIGAVERLYLCGVRRLAAIHRGYKVPGETTYRNAPLWEHVAQFRRQLPQLPIICDPSHMGGSRNLILPLSNTALSLGYDGLIIESQCNPDQALTDSHQQVTPETLSPLVATNRAHTA